MIPWQSVELPPIHPPAWRMESCELEQIDCPVCSGDGVDFGLLDESDSGIPWCRTCNGLGLLWRKPGVKS